VLVVYNNIFRMKTGRLPGQDRPVPIPFASGWGGGRLSRKPAVHPEHTLSLVRSEVLNGLHQTDLVQIQRMIAQEVERVVSWCRKHWSSPKDLPFDQFRAYTALQELLREGYLDRFVVSPVQQKSRLIRLPGITKVCDSLHQQFIQSAELELPQGNHEQLRPLAAAAYALIQKHGRFLQNRLGRKAPGSFSISNQAWYATQWLDFLCREENFRKHLQAVRTAGKILAEERKGSSRKLRSIPFQVRFYPGATLFRSVVKNGVLVVTIHEGFIEAPEQVLQAVIRAALSIRKDPDRHLISAYSSGEHYLRLARKLQNKPAGFSNAGGLFHDLDLIAARVQDKHFREMADRPVIQWMRRSSYRTFGVYQSSSHTVRISPALDHPDVPEHVLEYVIFHELAHAKVGVTVHRGRHRIHSKEFHGEEERFRRREEAARYLKSLSRQKYRGL